MTQRYIAHLSNSWSEDNGIPLWTTSGEVTPCGQWVQQDFRYAKDRQETVRHKLDHHWHETKAQAFAARAPKLRAIAARILRQADELEQAAHEETAASS